MIILMRHGEAESRAPSDAQRPLTSRGEQQVRDSIQWLAGTDLAVDRLIASPYLRAQQTAQIAQETFNEQIQTMPMVTPESDPADAERALQGIEHGLVCFHQPLIGRLIERWTGQPVRPSTGCLYVLSGDLFAPGWMQLDQHYCPN